MANHRTATGRGNLYFSRGQLLGVASLLVGAAVVIFFFGILIGQSIEERKLLSKRDDGVTVAVKPDAPGDDQEMTFYDTLTQPAPSPAPSRPVAPAPSPPAEAVQTPWTVQVAAAETRARAESMAAELKKRGYDAYVTSGQLNRKTFYRVRVGRYRTRREARVDLQRLKRDKYDPMIMGTE